MFTNVCSLLKNTLHIVWTLVKLDEQLWNKVNTNLKLFCQSFVSPTLFEFKPITYCGNRDTVLHEESKIEEEEEGELNSIQCDTCAAHYQCENITTEITTETNTSEWDCSKC